MLHKIRTPDNARGWYRDPTWRCTVRSKLEHGLSPGTVRGQALAYLTLSPLLAIQGYSACLHCPQIQIQSKYKYSRYPPKWWRHLWTVPSPSGLEIKHENIISEYKVIKWTIHISVVVQGCHVKLLAVIIVINFVRSWSLRDDLLPIMIMMVAMIVMMVILMI